MTESETNLIAGLQQQVGTMIGMLDGHMKLIDRLEARLTIANDRIDILKARVESLEKKESR